MRCLIIVRAQMPSISTIDRTNRCICAQLRTGACAFCLRELSWERPVIWRIGSLGRARIPAASREGSARGRAPRGGFGPYSGAEGAARPRRFGCGFLPCAAEGGFGGGGGAAAAAATRPLFGAGGGAGSPRALLPPGACRRRSPPARRSAGPVRQRKAAGAPPRGAPPIFPEVSFSVIWRMQARIWE